jgi:RNA-binding protein
MPLSGNQRRYLRSLAHHLTAIVQVGHQGVTEQVLGALDVALEDHELVKVRLAQAVDDRETAVEELVAGTKSECVQRLGRTAVLYRAKKKKPVIALPKPHTPVKPGTQPASQPAPELDDDEVADEETGDDDE